MQIVRLAATIAIAACPLWPVTLQQLSTAQMTGSSTAIVRGTVTGSFTALTGRTIFTHYKVQVSETWKGASVSTVDVALPGGAWSGVRQSFAGVPLLQTGKEYILFLWTGSKGPTQLTGLTQGALEVKQDESGKTVVSRRATGEIMLNSLGRPIKDQPVLMDLSEMQTRVTAAMTGGLGQ